VNRKLTLGSMLALFSLACSGSQVMSGGSNLAPIRGVPGSIEIVRSTRSLYLGLVHRPEEAILAMVVLDPPGAGSAAFTGSGSERKISRRRTWMVAGREVEVTWEWSAWLDRVTACGRKFSLSGGNVFVLRALASGDADCEQLPGIADLGSPAAVLAHAKRFAPDRFGLGAARLVDRPD
jgi:hypothetical protein